MMMQSFSLRGFYEYTFIIYNFRKIERLEVLGAVALRCCIKTNGQQFSLEIFLSTITNQLYFSGTRLEF